MIIKDLDKSIFPTLSNNSHELFHSNLWKWLIEQDNEFATIFFDHIPKEKLDVYREKKHADLIIKDADSINYVIENKFKSVPDKNQLEKYKKKIDKNGKNNQYLLTYLIDFDSESNGWNKLDYLAISKKLKKLLFKKKRNPIIKRYFSLLNEYCDFISAISHKILSSNYIKDDNYYGKGSLPKKIKDDDLKAIFMKMKAERFKEFIEKETTKAKIKEIANRKGCDFFTTTSFNHGKTTVSFRICKGKKEDYKKCPLLEIQLEGSQYRYMARFLNKGITEKKAFQVFKGIRYFNEDYDKKNNNLIHKLPSSMTHKSCKYKNKDSTAIYQYNDINGLVKYSELSTRIIKDLKDIIKILDNKKIVRALIKK